MWEGEAEWEEWIIPVTFVRHDIGGIDSLPHRGSTENRTQVETRTISAGSSVYVVGVASFGKAWCSPVSFAVLYVGAEKLSVLLWFLHPF